MKKILLATLFLFGILTISNAQSNQRGGKDKSAASQSGSGKGTTAQPQGGKDKIAPKQDAPASSKGIPGKTNNGPTSKSNNTVKNQKGSTTAARPNDDSRKPVPGKSKEMANDGKSKGGVVLKKDGTPDKRYNNSKAIKKDGTPEKRN